MILHDYTVALTGAAQALTAIEADRTDYTVVVQAASGSTCYVGDENSQSLELTAGASATYRNIKPQEIHVRGSGTANIQILR